MKTILGIEVGIVVALMLVLWVTAPGREAGRGGDGPMLVLTVENGRPVRRLLETPRAVVMPYVMGAGVFLAVAVPVLARVRGGRRGE